MISTQLDLFLRVIIIATLIILYKCIYTSNGTHTHTILLHAAVVVLRYYTYNCDCACSFVYIVNY